MMLSKGGKYALGEMGLITLANGTKDALVQTWRTNTILRIMRPAHLRPIQQCSSFWDFSRVHNWTKTHNGQVVQRITEIGTEDEDTSEEESIDSKDAH